MHSLNCNLLISAWEVDHRGGRPALDVQLHSTRPSSCALIGHVLPEDLFVSLREIIRTNTPEQKSHCGTIPRITLRSCLAGQNQNLTGRHHTLAVSQHPYLNGSPAGQDEFLQPPCTDNATSTLAGHLPRAPRRVVVDRAYIDVWSNLRRVPEAQSWLTRKFENRRQPTLVTRGCKPHQGKAKSTHGERGGGRLTASALARQRGKPKDGITWQPDWYATGRTCGPSPSSSPSRATGKR